MVLKAVSGNGNAAGGEGVSLPKLDQVMPMLQELQGELDQLQALDLENIAGNGNDGSGGEDYNLDQLTSFLSTLSSLIGPAQALLGPLMGMLGG